MKILVVAPNVDMGELRGDSIHLRNVVSHWSKDHEVQVISATDESDCPEGVDVAANATPSSRFLPDHAERLLRALFATLDARRTSDYDLVYERHHLFGSGLVGASFADCPKVLEVNGSPVREHELRENVAPATRCLLKAAEHVVFRLADGIVSVSPKVADDVRSSGVAESKLAVVANGCDPDAFSPVDDAKRRLGWDEDATHVGFVGGLNEWHGVGRIVEALPRVLEERPTTRFVVVGDGPSRTDLEERVTEQGVESQVDFLGQVPHEDVPLYMSAFDVGTILKHPEIPGSPLKLYEYLACGTPVVATDDADFDLLDGTTAGEKARYHDTEDVARAIVSLLDAEGDPAAEARSLALDHSWETVAERVLDAALASGTRPVGTSTDDDLRDGRSY
jgi:glycosyltransferase involved in cell wall biosynthesis